jgi:multiple sugar transport system permease protein
MKISLGWNRLSLSKKEAVFGYLFILPWILGFLLLRFGPMLASLILSFTEYKIISAPVFIGLDNFKKMFTNDPSFLDALRVTLTYAIFAIPIGMSISLVIALLLNQKIPGVTVWRTIYYLPSVVSGVAVATLWVWLFHSQFGLINLGLGAVGIHGPAWLRDPDWALVALIIMSFWSIGGGMVINLAGLQGIPTELYEAASIDGANSWERFWSITIPMLSPILFFNLVMGVIDTFQYFTNAYVMTNGGPGRSTLFYNLYLFQNAFRYYKMGYASALAWVMFLIILVMTLLIFKSSPYWVYYENLGKK